jgi:hypothetical protein
MLQQGAHSVHPVLLYHRGSALAAACLEAARQDKKMAE